MTKDQLRAKLLAGIDKLSSKWFVDAEQKRILAAQWKLWSTNDAALSALLEIVNAPKETK